MSRFPRFGPAPSQPASDDPRASGSGTNEEGRPRVSLLTIATVCWIAAAIAHFWLQTRNIHWANTDDLWFERLARTGAAYADGASVAKEQGRFYLPLAMPVAVAPYSLPPLVFPVLRALLLLANSAAVGLLFARSFRSTTLWPATITAALLLAQVPLAFYGLLSSLQLSLGLLLCTLVTVPLLADEPRPSSAPLLGLATLLACCMNESFLPPLVITAGGALVCRSRNRAALGVLASAGIYTVIYFAFRSAFAPQYDGLQTSFRPFQFGWAMLVYTTSTFPGFELLSDRHGFGPGPLFKSGAEMLVLLRGLTVVDLLLIGSGALIIVETLRRGGRPVFQHLNGWILAVAAVSFLGPISATDKYQVWAHQRQYPYLYSMGFWFIFIGLAVLCLGCLVHAKSSRRQAMVRVAVTTTLFLLGCAVWASNRHVTSELQNHPYPLVVDGAKPDQR